MTQNLPDNYDEASPQSAELFHLIVENVKDYAIFMTDADGFVVSWNPSVERLLRFTESEIVGQLISLIFTPEDVAADVPAKEMEQAARTGCAEDKRWHRRKDDSRFWANGMLMSLKNADGGLRGFAKIMRDDTAQKLAEEKLEQTNRHFENILESITDAFFTLDHDWRFTYLNKQSESLLQRKREELLGKNIWEEFPEAVETVVYEQCRIAIAEQVALNFEVFYVPLDIWAEVRVYPSPDGLSVYFQKITERKRAEELLVERERLAILNSDLSLALVQSISLDEILQSCAEVLVKHLDAAFARIWTLNEAENVLELQASAGIYTHLDGEHSRVPIGKFKIGRIAEERQPHLTNSVIGDAQVSNQEWARREGMVAFAGYPLIIGERLVGVVAMFARQSLDPIAVKAIESAANVIALGIERNRVEVNLKNQKTLLEALTESVLDGIVIVSTEGKMLHYNRHFLDLWNFPPEVVRSRSDEAALLWAANQTTNPAAFLARVGAVYEQPDTQVREEMTLKDGRVFERFGAPIHNGNLRLGWVWTFRDVTIRKRAETNFAFLAEISQELNRLTSVREITEAMTDKIGQYFGVSNCVFAEVDTTANTAIIDYCWRRDDNAVDLTGNYQLSAFISEEFRQSLINDKPVIINDVAMDSRTAENAAKIGLLKVGSFVNTPFVSDGFLKFLLGVYRPEPYEWRADEIELLGEVMTRVWTRIQRARAEELLGESEESYRILAETASDAIIRIDEKSTIEYVNPAAERIFGYAAAEMRGQPLTMLMPEELRELHLAGFGRYLETGKRHLNWQSIEVPARHKDGHHFPLEISFGEYHSGDIRFFIGIVRDVTERARAAQALRDSEEKFRDLANSISQLAWMADDSGSIFWYNNRWFDYTGTNLEEMRGWGWQAVHHPEEIERVTEKFKHYVASGDIWEDTFPLRSKTGEFRWFLSRALPIRDERGKIVRWFGTNTDIEEVRQARLQAEQANRLKDEFLATLSHELRTPLNAILGWSQILQSQKLGESEAKKALMTIERNARAQNQLIDDLLDVSRIITGKLRLDVRAIDLSQVITAAIDTARPSAEAKNIRLQILLDPAAGPISGDPDRLQQVIWNLLSNAVKFTPKDGRVQARLERVNSHVEIVISDTGAGIEPEFLPHVFDRFRQSDGSMTRRHGGLGLGLAIVRQLVELHGGTVSVNSEGSGQGSTFTVKLPLLPVRREETSGGERRVHPKAETGALADCPPELSDLHVLLVDDEADSRDLLNLILGSCGATVTLANSAAEAFEAIKREKIDIVVSDIGMPEEDGFSLIRKIRELSNEEGGNVPAIALTAYARAEDRVRALRSGFQMHIAKPVESSELIVAVTNLAGRMRNPN